jgi:CBS domain-containing protein
VEELMSKQVVSCLAGDEVRDAAALMDRTNRGALFVLSEDGLGRIEGVLTDRDIGLAVGQGRKELGELNVRGLMSATPHVCHPSDDLEAALQIIETSGCRRLPVVDDAGHVLGAITLTDIAREAVRSGSAGVSTVAVCRALVACASERRDPEHRLLT